MSTSLRAPRLLAALGLSSLVMTAFPLSAGAATPSPDLQPTGVAAAVPGADAQDLSVVGKARPKDKLGQRDREALAKAQADGKRSVTVLVAAARGRTASVAADLGKFGGTVRYRNDEVGYVRAVLPTKAVERTARLGSVAAVDLNELLRLPDPRTGLAQVGRFSTAGRVAAAAAPGPDTPADNPYLPTTETGATDFVRSHPTWDGRGVTIGVLDTGVDLDHPALQTTTTGQRKVADWFSVTDPLLDGDQSWRAMLTEVTGPTFTFAGRTWTAPAGAYRINRFSESATAGAGSEYGGDVNRDGDTTDSWGVLYRASDHAIWVDTDQDADFTDEELRRPYGVGQQVGHFGTDDPATPVHESVPFVVSYREDVDLSPAGVTGTADFVNIGIVSDSHGTHVAGIAAGHSLFGGDMDGAAPGARIVAARGCLFVGGCSSAALTDGMVELVVHHGVDVVNMSIGGLPALNDGNNARTLLYNRLIEDYGVQLFLSDGNDGPGVNTAGDPGVATDAVSVGASVSKATWLANYGAAVSANRGIFNFSSRGPREDGGMKPNLTAPGAAVSSVPMWQEGQPVAEAGYALPPGYGMFNGTSMAAPQATGGAALLLSAGKAADVAVTPAQLRTALYSSARYNNKFPAYAQGVGELRVPQAWSLLRRGPRLIPGRYDISAGVCTALSAFLVPPNRGTGIFNRCAAGAGGIVAGRAKTYEVKITRRSGPAGNRVHALSWLGNDGSFTAPRNVVLPLNTTVVLKVTVRAGAGAHGAVLRINDPGSLGVDGYLPVTVVVGTDLAAPSYAASSSGRVERGRTQSFFVTVPVGAKALRVSMSGLATGSMVRFVAFHPYGVAVDDTGVPDCYTNNPAPADCNALTRSYSDPTPGVWELEVEARRIGPYLRNPYRLTAAVQGVTVAPEVAVVNSAAVGEANPLTWTVTNQFAPVGLTPQGGPLGSAYAARPSIATNETDTFTVEVPEGVSRLDATIGNPADLGADLDLTVLRDGVVVGQSADGDSEEAVRIDDPEAGTYTVEVFGYDVPAGTTEYDYQDVFYAESLGSLDVDGSAFTLATGASHEVEGSLTALAVPADDRLLFGEMTLVTPEDAVVGRAGVIVGEVREAGAAGRS